MRLQFHFQDPFLHHMKHEITSLQLKELIEKGEQIILVDVREAYEHEGFNIGGTLIPLNQLRQRFRELDADKKIVVYCQRGNRSAYAVNFLVQRGFENAKTLAGGIEDWAGTIDSKLRDSGSRT